VPRLLLLLVESLGQVVLLVVVGCVVLRWLGGITLITITLPSGARLGRLKRARGLAARLAVTRVCHAMRVCLLPIRLTSPGAAMAGDCRRRCCLPLAACPAAVAVVVNAHVNSLTVRADGGAARARGACRSHGQAAVTWAMLLLLGCSRLLLLLSVCRLLLLHCWLLLLSLLAGVSQLLLLRARHSNLLLLPCARSTTTTSSSCRRRDSSSACSSAPSASTAAAASPVAAAAAPGVLWPVCRAEAATLAHWASGCRSSRHGCRRRRRVAGATWLRHNLRFPATTPTAAVAGAVAAAVVAGAWV
jgi:hypothetical protein